MSSSSDDEESLLPPKKHHSKRGTRTHNTGSRSNIMTGFAVIAAIVAIVLGGVALGKAGNSSGGIGGVFENIKITGTFDLSMAENVVPQPWFVPQPPVKRTGSFNYDITESSPTSIVLAYHTIVRLPSRMPAGLVGKEYIIYSNSSFVHEVNLITALNEVGECTAGSEAAWDPERLYQQLTFDAAPGSFISFRIVNCNTIVLTSFNNIQTCDFVICVSPTFSPTVTSQTIVSLNSLYIHSEVTNSTQIFTNVTRNAVHGHITSGQILSTHAMQTLANDPELPPPNGTLFLADAPLGTVSQGKSIVSGNILIKAVKGGPWHVLDLLGDAHSSPNDPAGTRVIQGGYPEVFGDNGTCTPDLVLPGESTNTILEMSSANFQSGTLTLKIRSGSELGFDFVEVRQNGVLLYRVSGAGPSPADAYIEGTLTIHLKGTDIIQIAHIKDGSCWGGYDDVYVYGTLAQSPHLEMTIPNDMTAYVGKDIKVCSLDDGAHSIYLEGGNRHFDSNGYWKVIQFQGNGIDACCATFNFMSADRVSISSRDTCTNFCSEPNLIQCIDPLRPLTTCPFHGTWRSNVKGYVQSSYAEIDATKVPLSVTFHRGTVLNPLELSITVNYFGILPGTFTEFNDTNLHDPGNRLTPQVITFQPGGQSFVLYAGRDTNAFELGVDTYFEKATVLPVFASLTSGTTTDLPPDDPIAIFRAVFDYIVYEASANLAKEVADEKWIGFPAAKALMEHIISTGTGPINNAIIETRVTQLFNPEGITEFRTADYHDVVPPSRVVVSGFTGSCAALNSGPGGHLVAIAATNNQNDPNGIYMDYSTTPSSRTVHHKIGIFFDSSNTTLFPVFPGTNIANCTGTPLIEVSYGPITSGSNYIQTMGAIQYWFYEAIKVALHTRPYLFFDEATTVARSGVAHVREEWSDIIADLAGGADALTAFSHFRKIVGTRDNTATSAFYPNGASRITGNRWFSDGTADRRSWQGVVDLTGQYGIRPDREASTVMFTTDSTERATHWRSIVRSNYLDSTTVAYPAWKMIGTSRMHIDNLLAQFVYPGGEGDEFNTTIVPFGQLPPADYSYLWAASNPNGGGGLYPYEYEYNFVNEYNQEAIFFGRFNTNYTSGLNIGYIRFTDTQFYDVAGFAIEAEFCPTALCNETSPRQNMEALFSIYAKIMQYILIDLDCDHLIIDTRANGGGSGIIQTVFRSFFGSEDQQILNLHRGSRKDSGNGPLIDTDSFIVANGVLTQQKNNYYASPITSEANYPGSVLTNGEVVFLTDTTAGSGGDIFPNNFLGSAYDGQLGNNTQVTMIGSIDGRISGSSCSFGIPYSRDSPLLKNSDGVPIPSYQSGVDCGPGRYRADDTSLTNRHLGLEIDPATGLTGLAGGNPLPQDWDELVYKDLGYVTNTRSVLAGWTKPQTPTNVIEVNPLSMTIGSNTVTVTMSSPHGFSTGDDVALGSTTIPVSTTAGIPGVALTGGHIITVTGANTFTFDATGQATYPGYINTVATSSVTGVGGTIRITNRSQWRDAWIEASIATIVAQAKKRRYDSAHRERKLKRKQLMRQQKRKSVRSPDLKRAAKVYKRDIACPVGVTLTPIQSATPTKVVEFNPQVESDVERRTALNQVKQEAIDVMLEQLQSGGLCVNSDGALMATPSYTNLVKITFGGHAVKDSATTKKRTKGDAIDYNTCIADCGSRRNRKCFLSCGVKLGKD